MITNPGKGQRFHCRVHIYQGHPVFDGHFPGNPVVPGVCQIEMIRGLAEEITRKKIKLIYSDNIKFLAMIQPGTTPEPEITLDIHEQENRQYEIHGVISGNQVIFLKFKGNFQEE
ncbi:MAG: 3-hydroxyacyl-ACP dehydratase [Bacteroidota bacterium]|nr:3-hydroxyacyl-ACP dehydratase [Bacteroidota bacterium]